MKLKEAYRMAIDMGIENDPRPKEEVQRVLKDAKEAYDKLEESKKEYFDQEKLWNPYSDSRFLYGDPEAKVEELLFGIDISPGEIAVADRLREKGQKISGVVGHHPLGTARLPFPQVIAMQADMFNAVGVPINIAEGLLTPRIAEVTRAVMASNYNQTTDCARLLDVPLFNIHTPADNCVQKFLDDLFKKEQPKYVGDIIDLLMTLPEYKIASKHNAPPEIIHGNKKGRAGKIISKMTGGTSGPKEIFEKLAHAGVGTVVGMHFPDNHIDEAKKYNINVVIAGHMSSDSLGINLISDRWEKKGGIKVVPFSGLIRVSRN